jgi:hypothetical protein
MSNQHIGLSNATDQWFTPPEILDRVRQVFDGQIHLDPCGSAESNKTVQASRYFTLEDQGVDQFWGLGDGMTQITAPNVFCNPPSGKYQGDNTRYKGRSNASAFFDRCVTGWGMEEIYEFIYLGYSIEQLQTLQNFPGFPPGVVVCVPKKRIRFVDQSGNRNSPTHGNFILYGGVHDDLFYRAFQDVGMILSL